MHIRNVDELKLLDFTNQKMPSKENTYTKLTLIKISSFKTTMWQPKISMVKVYHHSFSSVGDA